MVGLGINPAGVDYADQFSDELKTIHWSRAFEWDKNHKDCYTLKPSASQTYKQRMLSNLSSAIFANSFGKYMGVSVLDSGIGYICCKRIDNKENSQEYLNLSAILAPLGLNVYDFTDAFIRILGDNYRYKNDDFEDPTPFGSYNGSNKFSKKYKKYIQAVADKYKIDENILGEALFDYFHRNEGDSIILNFSNLGFRLLDENAGYYVKDVTESTQIREWVFVQVVQHRYPRNLYRKKL